MNGYQGQILASDQLNKCFNREEEIFLKIKKQCNVPVDYIQAIGIQATPGTKLFLNNHLVQIGQYGTLQLNNVKIRSIIFSNDADSRTKIDYIIQEK